MLKIFATVIISCMLNKGRFTVIEKEGLMAPPRESWVAFGGLLGLLKTWIARPIMAFTTGAADVSNRGELAAESDVADSSDLLKRRMRALHLDPDDLVRAPARMAGIKTGLCAKCEARGKCMRDLD